MSNRVTITSTKFVNVKEDNSETLGFRMYDDEGQMYDNTWDAIPDEDLDVLAKVIKESSGPVSDMLDFIQLNQKGIYIDGSWYDWDDIKHLFEEDEDSENG
jgi:hypothetical protein